MAAGYCYCLGINSNAFFLNDYKKAFILGLNVPKVTAYLKPLDSYLRDNINKKIDSFLSALKLSQRNRNADVHRIIMHYNYEHYTNHVRKYDNYIALYGFLRSLSLLCSSIFVFLFIAELKTLDFHATIDWKAVFILTTLFCVTYLYYLGFIKFYRRYTLENLMSILVDDTFSGNIAVQANNND